MLFNFYSPTNVIFGSGKISQLSEEIARLNKKKAFLVTGKESVRKNGILHTITANIKQSNLKYKLFDKVYKNPDTKLVDEGLELASAEKCDIVIGIGGGSVIDCAKAIAGLFNEKGFTSSLDFLEVDGTKTVSVPGLPFISVPTVAGTGAEVTKNAVIVNPDKKTKRSIRHQYMFAKTCIIDPELTVSVPREVTAISSIDAFCHLIEGYISKKSTSVTDVLALEGLNITKNTIFNLVNKTDDIILREKMSFASFLGGVVISNSGLTLAHGIGSVIGPRYNIPHGISCSICLPEILKLNWPYIDKLKRNELVNIFGTSIAEYINNLLEKLGLPKSLSELDIKKNDIESIAKKSLETSSSKGNPREVSLVELENILNQKL
ncbi:MAG: iron-containing alcohol dehydrogenase [Endomicrobiales bacterium]|nr:iron-containing alcohol dehydrogenase [Endomicrobiales bacterium]